jgi:hypothetical protein
MTQLEKYMVDDIANAYRNIGYEILNNISTISQAEKEKAYNECRLISILGPVPISLTFDKSYNIDGPNLWAYIKF